MRAELTSKARSAGRWPAVPVCLLGALGVFAVLLPASLEAASARPDRVLYEQATSARATLAVSKRLQPRRPEWERVIQKFRAVVARYPQSGFSDNSLMAEGDMYREMATRFATPRYAENAQKAYRRLAADYPSSSLCDDALYSVFEIARDTQSRQEVADAAKAYVDAFPDAKRARLVKTAMKKAAPVQEAALPKPPPPGLARVFNLRFWSGEASTRVVIDVEREVPIHQDRVKSPERLWVDLVGTRLNPNLQNRAFPVGDGLLEQVRLAQNKDDVVRVVLDFKDVKEHSVFYMPNPTRLVIDVKGTAAPKMASSSSSAVTTGNALAPRPFTQREPTPAPMATPAPLAPVERGVDLAAPDSEAEPYAPGIALASPRPTPAPPSPTPAPVPAPTPSPSLKHEKHDKHEKPAPSPSPTVSPSPAPSPAPSPTKSARRDDDDLPPIEPSPSAAPQANRTGSFSLARQLGLGARRIVIDAGHGGHDPGTIGRAGLQEKDLVLDVALRLAKLVRSQLGADVVMTRDTDVFIPLEERTAIANAKGADLFLSVHANSSRNPSASGIETYFLNFAANPQAEEVAARENAISKATLKDLQGLVKAITLNSKIDESHDFAASVQDAMVGNLKAHNPDVINRGVHTAPFYVLIGANMPSVLAEIAFVSNPNEERLLKTGEYREKIANSLFQGVKEYLQALNRTQTRQLTSSGRRTTVAWRSGRH